MGKEGEHMRDTIDMAREVGAIHINGKPKEFALVGNDNIKAFEALVRADEREACAKVCEEYADDVRTGVTCAKAIRARGNT
jgi:hypothetical protein